jgi:adenylate kinase
LRIVLLGSPGAGKGTQAKLICESLNVPHISTGDIFRENISKSTILGGQVKSYLQKGELVPDEVTIAAVKNRLDKEDCCDGFLLDGFPRNINQAGNLNKMLFERNRRIDAVFFMDAPDQLILDRLTERRYCSECGTIYNNKFNPSKVQGICDHCGSALLQREDDKEEVILERIAIYNKTIKPLVDLYSTLGILYRIPVTNNIEEVFYRIKSTLKAV